MGVRKLTRALAPEHGLQDLNRRIDVDGKKLELEFQPSGDWSVLECDSVSLGT